MALCLSCARSSRWKYSSLGDLAAFGFLALGAALAIAVLFSLQGLELAPLASLMSAVPVMLPPVEGTFALKANVFTLELFKYACLSGAGAYFGEVAQEKARV